MANRIPVWLHQKGAFFEQVIFFTKFDLTMTLTFDLLTSKYTVKPLILATLNFGI